jgi:hypothetical protein
MDITERIQKLSSFIEENTRASETSGITYIDPRNFKNRILLKQNHVIFGRRGAGKSSLIKTLKENKNYYYSYTNLEDLKDISFPNILIHVLNGFYSDLTKQLKTEVAFYQFRKLYKTKKLCKKLNKAIMEFESQIPNPDTYTEEIKTKQTSTASASTKVASKPVELSGNISESNETEVAKNLNRNKLESLKNAIPNLKKALKEVAGHSPEKPIFIIFDDFYFLPKHIQLFYIDFFHRLTKDTHLFIKVATIKHRSKIYAKLDSSHFGTEIGHDIHEIDLDYNLNRFDELQAFMRSLIDECARLCKIQFSIDDIFSAGAFTQLCLASGGVPRDFLTLFVKVCNDYNESTGRKISKTVITEAAIQNMSNKNSSLGTDSAEEKEVLESYLLYIKEKIVQEKKTNMFLVSNNEIEQYPQARQAIKELVDLRMIHLVEPDTSASGGVSGQRYTAYMVDIGLYPSSFQINFKQLDPGVTDSAGRKDEMRGAPKIKLSELQEYIESKNLTQTLQITDE